MGNISIPEPKERNLYLAKQVNQDSINEITKAIIDINQSDETIQKISEVYGFAYNPQPIKLYIDSYGGHVYQCLGLLGVMETSNVPIHTIVTGCAMSCGFLISIAGHERYGYKESTFLYHQVSSMSWGTAAQMEEDIFETKRLQKIIEKHVRKYTGITRKELKEVYKTKTDWFFNSTEALELRAIDEII
jgi:ATP-dependent Clp protease protease subunit